MPSSRHIFETEQFSRESERIAQELGAVEPFQHILTVLKLSILMDAESYERVPGTERAQFAHTKQVIWGQKFVPRLRVVFAEEPGGDIGLYWIEVDPEVFRRPGPHPPSM
ncbi:MAG: hypothetical protein M3Y56_14215 [Armatimonadota bacterium]|nr:hypothetical protein [Armatimonadota bacterium]